MRHLVDFFVMTLALLMLFEYTHYLYFAQVWLISVTCGLLFSGCWFSLKAKITTEMGHGSVLCLLGLPMGQVKRLLRQIILTALLSLGAALALVVSLDRSRVFDYQLSQALIWDDLLLDSLMLTVSVVLANWTMNYIIKNMVQW